MPDCGQGESTTLLHAVAAAFLSSPLSSLLVRHRQIAATHSQMRCAARAAGHPATRAQTRACVAVARAVLLMMSTSLVAHCIASTPHQCSDVQPGTCLPTSMPILQTINASSVAECCDACANTTACASWTLRVATNASQQHGCYLRATYDKAGAKHAVECTSGTMNRPLPPPPPPAPPGSPNVLLMLVDDLRPWLPFYGAELLRAPNLAKLAASAVQFNNRWACMHSPPRRYLCLRDDASSPCTTVLLHTHT